MPCNSNGGLFLRRDNLKLLELYKFNGGLFLRRNNLKLLELYNGIAQCNIVCFGCTAFFGQILGMER